MSPTRLALVTLLAGGLAAVAADDRAANWAFDEGQGAIVHDRSRGARHAVFEGAPTWVEERPGLTTLALDGKDDCVVVPGEPVLEWPQSFTLSLWVAVHGGGEPTGLLVKSDTLRLLYYPKGKRFLLELKGDNLCQRIVPGELAHGKWHLVALVRDAGEDQVTLFVDGVVVKQLTEPIGQLRSGSAPIRIGSGVSRDKPRFLAGAVARVELRSRALSEKEIQSMCAAQREAFGNDMSVALPPAPSRDSRWPLLLVDTTQIAVNDGVGLTVCEAVRYPGNPVVRLGGPGSVDEVRCHFDGSVYYLDGRFRMWYWAMPGGPAYAESADGIHWVKPTLGLVDFRGSNDNNLVPMPGRPMIYHDPDDPDPQRRFKKAVGLPNPSQGGRESLWTVAYSPDGIHWSRVDRPTPSHWENAESQVLTRVGDQWIIYTQGLTELGRTVMAFRSKDLNQPVWEWPGQAVWAMKDKYPMLQAHHGIKPWPRPGLTIGVYGIFLNRTELIDTEVELGFALSHDGFTWWEPWPKSTLLRRGEAGAWDSMFLVQGYPCFVNVRDQTHLYYGGTDHGNIGIGMQVGLATLRRDGFGYVGTEIGWSYAQEDGARTSSFTSVPIRLHDTTTERVLLNLDNTDAARDQWVKVELLDARGRPIPGHTLAEADPVTANGIAVPATWKRDAALTQVGTDVIRLRVHFHGGRYRRESPKLYAVYFREPPDIEQ